jgi:streptogramin lyase
MRATTFLFFCLGLLFLCGLPARADTVYVTSFSTGELVSYDSADPAGTKSTLLAAGSLVSPGALALGPDGNLYIGENGDGSTFAPRISKFEPATLTLSTVYAFGAFEVFPASLVFQGNDLLIGRNPFFGNTGAIVKLSNATGGSLAISDYTSGGSLASSPGLALAADGSLYVSDQTYNFGTGIASGPVKRFDAGGSYAWRHALHGKHHAGDGAADRSRE